jgi:CRP/FNR family transcriptional regulator
MSTPSADVLARMPLFRRVRPEDLQRIASVSTVRDYARGELVFDQGDPSESFYVVIAGRVKVFRRAPNGTDLILEIFGAGEPLGAVAAFEARPYPASADALEPSSVLLIPRESFFALLESHPLLVRGLLGGLSLRLLELTKRLSELTAARIDVRLARLFVKLGDQLGRPDRGGLFVPLALTRLELAELTGTTVETCIRVMSRWGKEELLRTEKDGFVIVDRAALQALAES